MKAVGISNRESPEEEAREREALPPVDVEAPPSEDAVDKPAPAAHKVGGAFGKESEKPLARDRRGSLHARRTSRPAIDRVR